MRFPTFAQVTSLFKDTPSLAAPQILSPEQFLINAEKIIKKAPGAISVAHAVPILPKITEVRGKPWVCFGGEKNNYPQLLRSIVDQSTTQKAIINMKSTMMAGDGFLINGAKTPEESAANLAKLTKQEQDWYAMFLENPNGTQNLQDLTLSLSEDWQYFGAFALETVWNIAHDKVVVLKHKKVDDIRSGYYLNNKIDRYWYSRDWEQYTKSEFKPKPIATFDPEDKEYSNQLIYVKNGSLDYYGIPPYSHGIAYVEIDSQIPRYHLANLAGNFQPGVIINFPFAATPEEMLQVSTGLKASSGGVEKTGGVMLTFSDGAELAPTVTPIPENGIHLRFLTLADSTTQNLLTCNGVTSPLLMAIATPGRLGGSTEIDVSYKIMNRAFISPARKKIESVYNKILKINGMPITLEIIPYNPFV